MKYTHIIWDWNGTLLNDLEFSINTMNGILKERGLKPISTIDEYRDLFCFPILKYYDKLGFDYSTEPFEKLAIIFIERYIKDAHSCSLFQGTLDVLSSISKAGKTQLILSASEKNALSNLISYHSLGHYFERILALGDHYAFGKTELGRSYIKSHGSDNHRFLLIGDTVHDYEVAQALNCNCILISGGHQSESALRATGAPVVDDIRNVVEYII